MQEQSNIVRSEKKVVGTATYQVYDSTAEAIEHLTESVVLNLVNVQVGTRARNLVRQTAPGKMSKKAILEKAYGLITKEDFDALGGDPVTMTAKIQEYVQQVEAENKAIADDAGVTIDDDDDEE